MHRLFALLSCISAAFAAPSYLFSVEGESEQLASRYEAGFRGTFDGISVWRKRDSAALDRYSASEVKGEDGVLVYLRPAVLDAEIFPHYQPALVLEEAKQLLKSGNGVQQLVLSAEGGVELLHESSAGAFWYLSRSEAHQALQLLGSVSYLIPTLVAPYDLPLPGERNPKAEQDRARVRRIIENLSFQSIIDRLAASIEAKDLRKIVRHLSAEDGKAPWKTRHSFTSGARLAAEWLKHEYEKTGASCYLHHYFTGFSPNVICSYAPLNATSLDNSSLPVVIIGAHYDDRGSFGYVRAPGADDDGSGSAMLLNLARTIKHYGIRFEDVEVILAAFSGEEQGLWGSRYFAKSIRDQGRDVLFMLQADMLAYRKPGEPLQVAYPNAHTIPEGIELITNISALYTPELRYGPTPACCSDHQSFDDLGFASSWVFERAGPISDPKYHNSGDLSDRDGYDWEQLRSISSLVLALLLSIAPFRL